MSNPIGLAENDLSTVLSSLANFSVKQGVFQILGWESPRIIYIDTYHLRFQSFQKLRKPRVSYKSELRSNLVPPLVSRQTSSSFGKGSLKHRDID